MLNTLFLLLDRFAIHASSGEIKTAVALDRETADQHNIQVICRDKGSPSRENVVQVLINVSDVNDHRPVFSQHHYFVAVKEQQQAQVILNLMVGKANMLVWFDKAMSCCTNVQNVNNHTYTTFQYENTV